MAFLKLPEPTGRTNEKGEEIFVTDEMIDNLVQDVVSGTAQEKAKAKTAALTHEDRCKLRIRAKRDLFFLCYGILGNIRLSPNLHGHLCRHVESTTDGRFHEY
jgi:hypothetical protein